MLGMAVASLVFVFGFPSAAYAFLQARGAAVAGLEAKKLVLDPSSRVGDQVLGERGGWAGSSPGGAYTVSYYQSEVPKAGPPLLLLHGLGDEKNSFVRSAALLTDRYSVYLPDLPGHGSNARDSHLDYSIRGQVEFLKFFVEALGLDTFHLGGSSLGGHLSAAYAARYPEDVERLMLLNPPGLLLEEQESSSGLDATGLETAELDTPGQSAPRLSTPRLNSRRLNPKMLSDSGLSYPGFEERVESREQYFTHLSRFVHTPQPLPGPMVDHLTGQLNDSLSFIRSISDAIKAGDDLVLNESLAGIRSPTLILWGRHDNVVPFEVALGYEKRIQGSVLRVIQSAGHFPHLDQPAEVGQEIRRFLVAAQE